VIQHYLFEGGRFESRAIWRTRNGHIRAIFNSGRTAKAPEPLAPPSVSSVSQLAAMFILALPTLSAVSEFEFNILVLAQVGVVGLRGGPPESLLGLALPLASNNSCDP
jgi:hypothetical protein